MNKIDRREGVQKSFTYRTDPDFRPPPLAINFVNDLDFKYFLKKNICII